ncbi:amino acid dehydrogenase [Roseovarius sp. SCSIO 43702]|uniref:Leu/Phe/Val dehydrogenase n=1 Tax=Roseovarius sp. SCSIO 43702 TaxID=2823043 RepID=UPI001C72DB04|nr:Glu/Leu/Phe/Val dehydrogenase dimerization domain-containing protein [Roseovarius sp. SCSIO 43702]QYX55776.1 amino acid dehydrogenase [Roseovarius sp. SCSIO 43702]
MLTRLEIESHEDVWRVEDEASGLTGFIALHSTRLGPAAGGLRMRPYPDTDAALADVLNLSRGMSYKNAAANLPLGGGKAVIIGHPDSKTPAMLRAMGRAIDKLEGRYWTAEDMGMSPADMAHIAQETDYVAGRDSGPFASGDPSPVTARGVFDAMRVGARHAFGSDDLRGRHVAVQGLGHVGWHLCRLLHETGARLTVADTVPARVEEARAEFAAEAGDTATIHAAPADIFAPCAIGGILNATTIPEIRARLVAGAANNQLAAPGDADALHARGILYLPDYVANGGGIINVAAEILRIEDRAPWVEDKLAALSTTMERILDRARAEDRSPAHLADTIVAERGL